MAADAAEDAGRVSLCLEAPVAEKWPADDVLPMEVQDADATVMLEDSGVIDRKETNQDPVLSLVSVNPKSAKSFDVVRGSFTILPDLPSLTSMAAAARTLRITCGRAKANTVSIADDARISLLHFTISVRATPGGCVSLELTDQSTNGTWVNGSRLVRGRGVPLAVGDSITVLPASQVGRDAEVGYLLVRDVRGAWCSSCPFSTAASPREFLPADDEGLSCSPKAQAQQAGSDDVPRTLERDLRCGICRDALHQCLTVVPCGHNFCGVCLAKWRRTSTACPECRGPIPQAVRNQTVDRMVETFLCAHPDAARSQEDLAAIEAASRDPEHRYVLRWLLQPPVARSVPTPQQRRLSQQSAEQPRAARAASARRSEAARSAACCVS